MKGSMLEIAKRDLWAAQSLINNPDDGMLQIAAYHLQQATEKCIKYVFECEGVHYPFGHNIGTLLESLPSGQTILSEKTINDLFEKSEVLTNWEQKTRYPNDYMAVRYVVKSYLISIEKLVSQLDGVMSQRPEQTEGDTAKNVKTVNKMNLFD